MRFITFVRQMFTSHSGISSKRVCGVIGWFVAVAVLIYCTIMCIQAPLMIDTFFNMCYGFIRNRFSNRYLEKI